MYQRILAPVDLAQVELADIILRDAKALCANGAEITLLFVMPEAPGTVLAQLPEGFVSGQIQKCKEDLEALARRSGAGDVKIVVESGAPQHKIIELAAKWGSDLVVIGSHRPEVADYLLGTTASHVVNHVKCSVHVVRA